MGIIMHGGVPNAKFLPESGQEPSGGAGVGGGNQLAC
jgi:hypothetical protein